MKYILLLLFLINIYFLYRLYNYSKLIGNYKDVLRNGRPTNYLLDVNEYLDQYEDVKSFKLSLHKSVSKDALLDNVIKQGIYPDDANKFLKFYDKAKNGDISEDMIRIRVKDKDNNHYIWTCAYLKVLEQKYKMPSKISVTINENNSVNRLTGLYNKNTFMSKTKDYIDKNINNYYFAMIDLKDFKHFNEINSYQLGDEMLQYIANVLLNDLKDQEVLSHINSDKFMMLISCDNVEDVEKRFKHIIERIRSFDIDNDHRFTIDPRVFIIKPEEEIKTIDVLIELITTVKRNYLKRYTDEIVYIDRPLLEKAQRAIDMEKSMEPSLRNNEFVVYVQPKYHLASGNIIGGEALVRWKHNNGIMQPGEFLPLFESNGFICRIDYYMFEQVCISLKNQIDNNQPAKPISVNFSRLHLYNKTWIKDLCAMAEKYDVPKSLLEIELTETIAVDNQDLLIKTIAELREVGFWVSMDDFGSGYSSLGILKNLKFNIIKLDKSFISDLQDVDTKVIVENIINLTKKLNKEIIAEGIETNEQIEFLKKLNCEYAQGYFFSKPMPLNEYLNLVN